MKEILVAILILSVSASVATAGNVHPTTLTTFAAPTVSSFTDTSVTLSWTNPSVVSTNSTVQYGLACGYHMTNVSEGAVVSSATLTLSSNEYCFDIQLWDAGTLVGLSGNLSFFLPGASTAGTGNLEIWNNASTASGSFDFLVNVSSGSLTSNASNFAFAYSNYTTVFAWIESNASNSAVNHVWLWLYSIPADSHENITLDIYPSTVQASRWNGPTGKSPLLTTPYGHEDDGALVFHPLYLNFTGTTCPSSVDGYSILNAGITWSCNNDAHFTSYSATSIEQIYIDYPVSSTENLTTSAFGNFGGTESQDMNGFTGAYTDNVEGNAEVVADYQAAEVLGMQRNAAGHITFSSEIGNLTQNAVWTGVQLGSLADSEFWSNEYNVPAYVTADAWSGTEYPLLGGGPLGNMTEYWFRMPTFPNSWVSTGGYKEFQYVLSIKAPPLAPTGLSVKRSATSAVLSWTNPAGTLANDTVYVGTTDGVWTQKISAGVVTSYTVTGLTSETEYWYAVGAWNAYGESPLSSAVNDKPPAPTNLGYSVGTLTWTPPPIQIYNDTIVIMNAGCSGVVATYSSGGNLTKYELTLNAGNYCGKVAIWGNGGESNFAYVNFTFSDPVFRVPITIHNPTTSETLNNTQVLLKVNWSAYKKYLAGNVSNVRFVNETQGFNYPAWLETNDSNASTSSNVWVNLTISRIPAGGNVTIYLVGYNTSMIWGTNWGLAPELTTPYGKYDNGHRVFDLYANFSGTTTPAGWTNSAFPINNGVGEPTASGQLYYTNAIEPSGSITPYIIDIYGNLMNTATTGYTEEGWLAFTNNGGIYLQSYPGTTPAGLWGQVQSTSGSYTRTSSLQTVKSNATYTISLNSTTVAYYLNYSGEQTVSSVVQTGYLGIYANSAGPNTEFTWIRLRTMVPDNIMPTSKFGSIYVYGAQPVGSLAVHRYATSALVSWVNEGTSIVNDTVYVGLKSGTWTQKDSTGGAVESYTVTGLVNGTEYWYSVGEWNSNGESSLANAVNDSPKAPSGLTLNVVNSTSISVGFPLPSFAVFNDSIKILKNCSSLSGTYESGNNQSYVNVSGLSQGEYCVEGAYWSYGGRSEYSPELSFSLARKFFEPQAPTLEVSSVGSDFIKLKWSAIGGAVVNYTIYYGFTCSFGNAISAGNVTVYTITGLVSGHGYCAAVQGWVDPSPSSLSNAVSTATLSSSSSGGVGVPPTGNVSVIHQAGVFISAFGLVIFVVLILLAAVWALVERRRIR